MRILWSLPLAFLLFACQEPRDGRETISLAGTWQLKLENEDSFSPVTLPGTTDTNGKGWPNEDKEETTHLSRLFRYQGKALYKKDIVIPDSWKGKTVSLYLERTKPAKVWVDSLYAGASDDISTPQEYDLGRWLSPGRHSLLIEVDNGLSVPPQLLENSHAYTESTQTNWNGIIGELRLEARPSIHISDIQVYPCAETKTVGLRIKVEKPSEEPLPLSLRIDIESFNTKSRHSARTRKDTVVTGVGLGLELPLGDDANLWSEFSPALYRLTASVRGKGFRDSREVVFGLRDFKVEGTRFTINGLGIFLRGKHDACVFPLTGHVPMDVGEWRRYFKIAKEYGINHCRFHSWCPPEACFEAADLEGVYLQPELPFWGRLERTDTALVGFLTKEGLNIQREYGNHASFVMMAIGNELSGDQDVMVEMLGRFREDDGRRLYASGSNDYLGYAGPAKGDDYFTTCRVPGENVFANHTRGSFSFADAEDGGYINHTYPNSTMSFETAVAQCPVPVIGHETGQFQCYPDYGEIKKYTGVLKPWNLEVFKKRLEDAGMGSSSGAFFKASGEWMARLYRAEIEMAFRTPGMAGFQLLDLQDYPGQGTALVGILDAFMDSKGLISPEEWKGSCSDMVLLASLPKFCYSGNEIMEGILKVANYTSSDMSGKTLDWALTDGEGALAAGGSLSLNVAQGYLAEIGALSLRLPDVKEAGKYDLRLSVEGTGYRNHYELWIYPANNEVIVPDGVEVVRKWDKRTERLLAEGAKVLWFPDADACGDVTVDGLFQTDYWNYRMFKSICEWAGKPVSPGTLGLLMDPEHPAFKRFPTDSHTNWQWFPVIKEGHPLVLDRLDKDYVPIVQVIDNVERNHKLGLVMEFRVGAGSLLVCMSDLDKSKAYPESRQLYGSLLAYMVSDSFSPAYSVTPEELLDLFTLRADSSEIRKLGNISYD